MASPAASRAARGTVPGGFRFLPAADCRNQSAQRARLKSVQVINTVCIVPFFLSFPPRFFYSPWFYPTGNQMDRVLSLAGTDTHFSAGTQCACTGAA